MIIPPQLTSSRVGALRLGIVGACYYISPEVFSQRVERFIKLLGSDIARADHRYALMRTPAEGMNICDGDEHWMMAQGDFLDISAYASAAAHIEHCDLYLVMNDTLFTKHDWQGFARSLQPTLQSVASLPAPAAVGEIHPSTDLLLLDQSNPARKHLSTFCFVLNQRGFSLFQSLTGYLPDDGSDERIRDWLEQQIRNYPVLSLLLHVHLFGPRSPWSWKNLGSDTSSRLILRKAVTMVFEYLLSVHILRDAGLIMPVNCRLIYRIRSRLLSLASLFTRR